MPCVRQVLGKRHARALNGGVNGFSESSGNRCAYARVALCAFGGGLEHCPRQHAILPVVVRSTRCADPDTPDLPANQDCGPKFMMRLFLFAALALSLLPVAAAAQDASELPTGNAARGKQLAYTCQGCHGVTGYKNAYPSYHVPYIGGQSRVYLTNALNGYREGIRQHPTMQAQARSFSDQDIADLATFLSEVKR